MPGCKASKDRLTHFLGANEAGDFKLKPMLVYHSKSARAVKNYTMWNLEKWYRWTGLQGRS